MNILKNPNKMKFLSLVVALIGFILILNSPKLGSTSTSSWVRSIGGSVGSDEYLQMLKGYMDSYRMIGAILLFTGLFSFFNNKGNR